mmetsp:Transcript_11967/g.15755  ORF Transcript_11967/g.15755 Transcript_11967/m.15755 type:complete len:377 (-) Transcript_11967:159-1289(-)
MTKFFTFSTLALCASTTSALTCVGSVDVSMDSDIATLQVVRSNHSKPDDVFYYAGPVTVDSGTVMPGMYEDIDSGLRNGGRAYLADSCEEEVYDPSTYTAFKLLDKTLTYTTDMSNVDCGCNAALYLVSMPQNDDKSACDDYYCDANAVCGVRCSEIDIQEGNKWAWHSTAHVAADGDGAPVGYGGGGDSWNGPRDFTTEEYGPGGSVIDTNSAFQVSVSFPTGSDGKLSAQLMILSQEGRSLSFGVDSYTYDNTNGFDELTDSLTAGMSVVFSYWCSSDMLWLDGAGQDGQGPCGTEAEDISKCGDFASFYDFVVTDGSVATDDGTIGSDDSPSGADDDCVELYSQCGGDGYEGSTTCCEGLTCVVSNEWWSGCQ